MKTKSSFIILLFFLVLFPACDDILEVQPYNPNASSHADAVGISSAASHIPKHLMNAGFQSPIDFNDPKAHQSWAKYTNDPVGGSVEWGHDFGRSSGGIKLISKTRGRHIAAKQTIQLESNKWYHVSGWIKTENVRYGFVSIGVRPLGWSGGHVNFTHDWQEGGLDFKSPYSGVVEIWCQLVDATGTAYFDDLSIEVVDQYVNRFVETGNHVELVLDPEDAAVVKKQTISNWVRNLDRAYEKYAELMQGTPYEGSRITIMSTSSYPGGWAVAGNPILWYKPYIQADLLNIETTGSWSFGIMHELGHDFAMTNYWVWHEEMFANFRMYYVAEELNAAFYLDNKLYTGTELEMFYKTDTEESYDNYISRGIPRGHNGVMYTLIRIKNLIGWEPFIKTYKDLNTSGAYGTHWQMFSLFLDKLSYYSGTDVRKTYLPGELDTIQALLLSY